MSQENVESFAPGSKPSTAVTTTTWIVDYHDDVVDLGSPRHTATAGPITGTRGSASGWPTVETSSRGLRFEPRSFRDAGDAVVVEVAGSGTGIGSGVAGRMDCLHRLQLPLGEDSQTARGFLDEERKPSKPPGSRSRRCRRRTWRRVARRYRGHGTGET